MLARGRWEPSLLGQDTRQSPALRDPGQRHAAPDGRRSSARAPLLCSRRNRRVDKRPSTNSMTLFLAGLGLVILVGLLWLIPRPKNLEPGSPAQLSADAHARVQPYLFAVGVLFTLAGGAYLLATWIW